MACVRAGKLVPGRPDPLIWDAPLTYHLPMLLIWVPFQATILYQLGASISGGPCSLCFVTAGMCTAGLLM